jgi:uncharacterized protein (TIGR03067 family)
MKAFRCAALLAGIWLTLPGSVGRSAAADRDELQGTWIATAIEINGKAEPLREVLQTRFIFKGDKLQIRHSKDKGRAEEGTFKTNRDSSPRQLDFTMKKKTLAGIYEVKGDTLKLCFETGGDPKKRPTRFATTRKDELVLVVFKRQKQ